MVEKEEGGAECLGHLTAVYKGCVVLCTAVQKGGMTTDTKRKLVEAAKKTTAAAMELELRMLKFTELDRMQFPQTSGFLTTNTIVFQQKVALMIRRVTEVMMDKPNAAQGNKLIKNH